MLPLRRELPQHARARGRAARDRPLSGASPAAEARAGAALSSGAAGRSDAATRAAPLAAGGSVPPRRAGGERSGAGGAGSDPVRALLAAVAPALGWGVGRDGDR